MHRLPFPCHLRESLLRIGLLARRAGALRCAIALRLRASRFPRDNPRTIQPAAPKGFQLDIRARCSEILSRKPQSRTSRPFAPVLHRARSPAPPARTARWLPASDASSAASPASTCRSRVADSLPRARLPASLSQSNAYPPASARRIAETMAPCAAAAEAAKPE